MLKEVFMKIIKTEFFPAEKKGKNIIQPAIIGIKLEDTPQRILPLVHDFGAHMMFWLPEEAQYSEPLYSDGLWGAVGIPDIPAGYALLIFDYKNMLQQNYFAIGRVNAQAFDTQATISVGAWSSPKCTLEDMLQSYVDKLQHGEVKDY
jgi:hypothetical protein